MNDGPIISRNRAEINLLQQPMAPSLYPALP
jgi:hypothetical protein